MTFPLCTKMTTMKTKVRSPAKGYSFRKYAGGAKWRHWRPYQQYTTSDNTISSRLTSLCFSSFDDALLSHCQTEQRKQSQPMQHRGSIEDEDSKGGGGKKVAKSTNEKRKKSKTWRRVKLYSGWLWNARSFFHLVTGPPCVLLSWVMDDLSNDDDAMTLLVLGLGRTWRLTRWLYLSSRPLASDRSDDALQVAHTPFSSSSPFFFSAHFICLLFRLQSELFEMLGYSSFDLITALLARRANFRAIPDHEIRGRSFPAFSWTTLTN